MLGGLTPKSVMLVAIVPAICAELPLTRSCRLAVTSLVTPWIDSVPVSGERPRGNRPRAGAGRSGGGRRRPRSGGARRSEGEGGRTRSQPREEVRVRAAPSKYQKRGQGGDRDPQPS